MYQLQCVDAEITKKKYVLSYPVIVPLVTQVFELSGVSFSNTRLPEASVRSLQLCALDLIPMAEFPEPALRMVSGAVSLELNVNVSEA